MKILVVDDSEPVQIALAALLEEAGHDVSVAGSAAEMWLACRASVPDVVLLDEGLPDASGAELARELRQQLPWPVVLRFSGDDSTADPAYDGEIRKGEQTELVLARIASSFRARANR